MPHTRGVCLIPLAFALLVFSASAQAPTGTLKGVLTDDSGAVIPAATVTLEGNGASKTVQSQADGTYTFPGLAPGRYTVKVSFPGFAPFEKPVAVNPGSTVTVSVQMALSAQKQEINVS